MKDKKTLWSFKSFVVLFILIIAAIIAVQIFGAARFETILAEQGEVIDGFWTDAIIIRDEKLFRSPISGRAMLMSSEGERAAAGTEIAEVSSVGQKIKIYNKEPGIISFAVDGLEEDLNKDMLDQINLNHFNDFKADYQHRISGRNINKSAPLYRVVNNFELYLIVSAGKKEAERFRINEVIFIQEDASSELLKGRIINIKNEIDNSYIFVKMDRFVPRWLNARRLKVNFIKNIYRGIKIPEKAIFKQPSGQGVLKVTGYNKYEFQEINILESGNQEAVVSGVEIGDEIITNPEDFDYGREG